MVAIGPLVLDNLRLTRSAQARASRRPRQKAVGQKPTAQNNKRRYCFGHRHQASTTATPLKTGKQQPNNPAPAAILSDTIVARSLFLNGVLKRALAIALAAVAFQAAAAGGVEVLTPHFRVLSVLEPGLTQAAAAYLETIRDHFESLGFELSQAPSPRIDVILFSTPDQMLPYAPPYVQGSGQSAGFFTPGADRIYMVIAWDGPGDPWVALSHEYVHRIFAGKALPFWLSEGVAEYLSRAPAAARNPTVGPAEPAFPVLHFQERLAGNPWLPWSEIWSAERGSASADHPNFRPQSWLLVHLLVSEGLDLTQLDPADVEETLTKQSAENIETRLRAALAKAMPNRPLTRTSRNQTEEGASLQRGRSRRGGNRSLTVAAPFIGPSRPPPNNPPRFDPANATAPAQPRELAPGEFRFALADLQRETGAPEAARLELEALRQAFPNRPEPSESLGALEMHQYQYDQAEQHLADAVERGSRNPRTHYRYSLMLMRPRPRPSPQRAAFAVQHAQLARQFDPGQPVYLLTEAQAHMTAEQWGDSAAALARLTEYPDWESRAQAEFRELQRRQQQQLSRLQRDVLPEPQRPFVVAVGHGAPLPTPGTPEETLPAPGAHVSAGGFGGLAAAPSGLFPALSRLPVPKPFPKPAHNHPSWPPPGTILLYGYISGVECREGEKIVTVSTPRYRLRLREPAGAPAKLYSKPKWIKGLECGLRGLEVNVAYRPTRGSREVRGSLVVVVF